MDWNRHETYKHLSVQQLQLKLDEINRERKTVPVFKNDDLDINSLSIVLLTAPLLFRPILLSKSAIFPFETLFTKSPFSL